MLQFLGEWIDAQRFKVILERSTALPDRVQEAHGRQVPATSWTDDHKRLRDNMYNDTLVNTNVRNLVQLENMSAQCGYPSKAAQT